MAADSQTERRLSIRQMCQAFDVTPRALRFYEDKGLLAPLRQGQIRLYGARERARLTLVLRGKRVGLSLAQIGELLDLYTAEDGGVAQAERMLPALRERISTLEAQREDIEHALLELRGGVARLEAQLAGGAPVLTPLPTLVPVG